MCGMSTHMVVRAQSAVCMYAGVDAVAVCPCNWQPVFSTHTSNAFRGWYFSSQILHEK